MKRTVRDALHHFGPALQLRCPNCGGRPIFRSWFLAFDLRFRPATPEELS